MKTQQQHEREEQQRIKNLVLNYDLRDDDQDGDLTLQPISQNTNIKKKDAGQDPRLTATNARPDKSSNNRSGQRARKLQLSDVDWYGRRSQSKIHLQAFANSGRIPAGTTSIPDRGNTSRRGRGSARDSYHAQSRDQGAPQQTGNLASGMIAPPGLTAEFSLFQFPALPSAAKPSNECLIKDNANKP